jgi:hypothetical protein
VWDLRKWAMAGAWHIRVQEKDNNIQKQELTMVCPFSLREVHNFTCILLYHDKNKIQLERMPANPVASGGFVRVGIILALSPMPTTKGHVKIRSKKKKFEERTHPVLLMLFSIWNLYD